MYVRYPARIDVPSFQQETQKFIVWGNVRELGLQWMCVALLAVYKRAIKWKAVFFVDL